MNFEQILITRFNIPHRPTNTHLYAGGKNSWMAHRIRIFEKYCLPSVMGQTIFSDFKWFILIDDETPMEWMKYFGNYKSVMPNIIYIPRYHGEDDTPWIERVASHLDGKEYLISSRLDNDDVIHRDYLKTVREFFPQEPLLVRFPKGYTLWENKDLAADYDNYGWGSFVNMIEKVKGLPKTAGFTEHGKIDQKFGAPVEYVDKKFWIQIIHGRNLGNRMMGKATVPMENIKKEFSL